MTEVEYRNSLFELNEIFKILDEKLIKKLPESFIKLVENGKADTYEFKLDPSKSLSEQKLSETTELFLTTLHLKYWCNEQEKQEILEAMRKNEKKYQEELREKYNPNNLFKNINEPERNQQDITADNKEETKVEELQMVKYKKESLFKRIIAKIKKFFSK